MNQSIRWGILGLGNIAQKFALDLSLIPEAQLSAVASRDIEKAKAFCANIPQDPHYVFGSYEALFNCEEVDVIYIATTLDDVSRMYHSTIPEKISLCEKNGGKVRLLVDMNDPKLAPFVKRFNATETKIGSLPSKGRMVVQKDKKMIMSDSTASSQNSGADSDYSLSTNSIEMVDNIFTLCSFLWEASKPLKTIDVKNFVKKSKA